MAVLSNHELEVAIEDGWVVCHPLIPENVRGSSIDLTLGEWYYDCGLSLPQGFSYNPFSEIDVEVYFGEARQALSPAQRGMGINALRGIPDDHPIIWLDAGARILAHTHEFVGINPPGTTEMRARSSWGRNGIAVCLCAGWGDPGYINRWTMEVWNNNRHAVPLPVGERIAQLIFHRTGPVKGSYGKTGKYQGSTELADVVEGWTPAAMLPRSYRDERRLPLPLDIAPAIDRFEHPTAP